MDFKSGYSVLYAMCIMAVSLTFSESANVLIAGLYAGGSHMMAMFPIARSLVNRGHDVTFLISDVFTQKFSISEYMDYFKFEHYSCRNLDREFGKINEQLDELALADNQASQTLIMMSLFADLNRQVCETIFSDDELLKRLDRVDVVVVDVVWPCGIYLKKFLSKNLDAKIRGVVVATMSSYPYIQQLAGSPVHPSYQPMQISGLSSNMSFLQRVGNTMSYLLGNIFSYVMTSRPYHGIVDRYGLDPEMKSSIHDQVDLYLINTEFAVEFPYPLMPNIIPVGGLTARPAHPLEDSLERFMQSSAEHGVIVFSLGSEFTRITKARPHIAQFFMEALGRLPQKVLFHLQADPPEDLPDNIKVLQWLPLQDVLGHPRTRLFVYHGGNNGFLEAVYHGVPLVIMPLVGDQVDVAVRVETMELGTTIDKNRLSADYIHQKLTEALQNPEYIKNVKRASAIFKDRPMSAPDRAAFWIEHVIKHGSSYMRSPAHDLTFIQYYLLDVISVLTFLLGTVLYVAYKSVRFCARLCRSLNKNKKSKHD